MKDERIGIWRTIGENFWYGKIFDGETNLRVTHHNRNPPLGFEIELPRPISPSFPPIVSPVNFSTLMNVSTTRCNATIVGAIVMLCVLLVINIVVHVHTALNPPTLHAINVAHHVIIDEVTVDITMIITTHDTLYVVTSDEQGTAYSYTYDNYEEAAYAFDDFIEDY